MRIITNEELLIVAGGAESEDGYDDEGVDGDDGGDFASYCNDGKKKPTPSPRPKPRRIPLPDVDIKIRW
jgi:hypothetical protein